MSQQQKPVFQRFVEANQGLLQCYRKVNLDDYKKMSGAAKDGLCQNYKETIKEILANDQMTMTTLVKERVMILKAYKPEEKAAGSQ